MVPSECLVQIFTLSYCRAYREVPSDTDTTSCFDSDGTYMRSEGGQSSDSGAALLVSSNRKRRRDGTETGIIR